VYNLKKLIQEKGKTIPVEEYLRQCKELDSKYSYSTNNGLDNMSNTTGYLDFDILKNIDLSIEQTNSVPLPLIK